MFNSRSHCQHQDWKWNKSGPDWASPSAFWSQDYTTQLTEPERVETPFQARVEIVVSPYCGNNPQMSELPLVFPSGRSVTLDSHFLR